MVRVFFYLFNRDHKKKPGKLLSEQTAYEDSEGSEYVPSESEMEELEGLYFMLGHTQTFCSTLDVKGSVFHVQIDTIL